jgi:hypothetical protein
MGKFYTAWKKMQLTSEPGKADIRGTLITKIVAFAANHDHDEKTY